MWKGGCGRPFFMSYDWRQSPNDGPNIAEIRVKDLRNPPINDSGKKDSSD
mgnify:CR=1 FL=1